MTYLILAILSLNAQAGDDWLCKQESSIQRGNSIYACGIAKGHDEQMARENAFYAAHNEFTRIHLSMEKVQVEAKRTECEPIPEIKDAWIPGANYYKVICYRLVVFTLPE